MPRRLGIDLGTTRADLVVADPSSGSVHRAKVPLASSGITAAIGTGVSELLARSGGAEVDTAVVALPGAIADPARAQVGLLVTQGFEQRLAQACGGGQFQLTRGVAERISTTGNTVLRLDEDSARRAIREVLSQRIDAVAICLLHAHRNPVHELRLRDLLLEHRADLTVFLSHKVAPEHGEVARARATVFSARSSKTAQSQIAAVADGLAQAGVSATIEMLQSTGSRTGSEILDHSAARLLASSGAGAAAAAASAAMDAGFPDALSVDIGSDDAVGALIRQGRARIDVKTETTHGPASLPSLDARSAGGGMHAVATVPMAGTLCVGSAVAKPACIGGADATVMDALAVLGWLPAERLSLDLDVAEQSVGRLAGQLGVDVHSAAEGIAAVAAESIAGGLRRMAVEKGEDQTGMALVASGGGGPLLACEIAKALGTQTIVVPRSASALAALGCAMSEKGAQFAAAIGPKEDAAGAAASIRSKAEAWLMRQGTGQIILRADLRCPGTAFRTSVALKLDGDPEQSMRDLFARGAEAYQGRYGHTPPRPIEVTTVRAIASVNAADARPAQSSGANDSRHAPIEQRQVWFNGAFASTSVFDGERLTPGNQIVGPALVLQSGTTVVVSPGATARMDRQGNVIIDVAPGRTDGRA